MRQKIKLGLLILTIGLALVALWQVRRIAEQVRESEEAKVRLWASAISHRNQMATATQQFFHEATLDEQRKMRLYTDILQSFDRRDMHTDLQFSLDYVHYIVDSSRTPIIITTTKDSIITVPQELAGQKLEGELLEEYSVNPPFNYTLWGMGMTLYYKESAYYTKLREVLMGFTMSFLSDITQNSVLVPVVVVDSSRRTLLACGNLDTNEINTPQKLAKRLQAMENENEPIPLTIVDNYPIFVYYSTTPLLRSLQWMPLFYFFVALVLLIVSYNLLRTTRTMEQNRIWVGLAKETAHQLGTPISSLSGWLEYFRSKTESGEWNIDDKILPEIEKDLKRLETVTHRFSKIGSQTELKDEDVKAVTLAAVEYLQNRSPKRIRFNVAFPEEQNWTVPLNGYLFQWVIENLCKNAVDAMEGDGTITIVASQDARKVYLDISDTGKGMSKSVQKHIFDSGFTTKTRGWGLGLPLARRIINQYHRGRLYLKYSVPGQGTCFRIALRKGN